MKKVTVLLCSILVIVLSRIMFETADQMQLIYPGISLRYDNALSSDYVDKIVQQDINGISLWGETEKTITGLSVKENIPTVVYIGDSTVIWPNEYIYGQGPGVLDFKGCALSNSLAWQLFGSNDVVGLSVEIDKVSYTICGVFDAEDALMLLPASDEDSFTVIDLATEDSAWDDPEGWVMNMIHKYGFPLPDQIIYGNELCAITKLAAWLPIIGSVIGFIFAFVQYSRQWRHLSRELFIFSLLFALAILLPFLLAQIPAWLTPSRWSDFTWWGDTTETIKSHMVQWLSINPLSKDIFAKYDLIKQFMAAVVEFGLLEVIRCNINAFSSPLGSKEPHILSFGQNVNQSIPNRT